MKAATQTSTKYDRIDSSISFDPAGDLTEQSHKEELNINNILARFHILRPIQEWGSRSLSTRWRIVSVSTGRCRFAPLGDACLLLCRWWRPQGVCEA